MSATKGIDLPYGTKVRMTDDHGTFNKGDIVTRRSELYDDSDGVAFESDKDWHYLSDYEWELIEDKEEIKEEPKEEIKERLPKQGDITDVKNNWNDLWECSYGKFIAFYGGRVIVEHRGGYPVAFDQWRFPLQEEVTLSDGNTYLVEERDGEKFLILKK